MPSNTSGKRKSWPKPAAKAEAMVLPASIEVEATPTHVKADKITIRGVAKHARAVKDLRIAVFGFLFAMSGTYMTLLRQMFLLPASVIGPDFDFANRGEVLLESSAVFLAEFGVERLGIIEHGVENAALAMKTAPLLSDAALGNLEESAEHHGRVALGQGAISVSRRIWS